MDSGFSSQHGLSSNFRVSSVRTSHPGICSPNNCCWRFAISQSKSLTTAVVDDPIQNRFRTSLLAFIGRSLAGAEAKNARERGYWTPQILPLNSPFHRPLTPNTLLGLVQRMNGPSISSCPEAGANLPVPFTTFAVAL
jgi:hypothetical protein